LQAVLEPGEILFIPHLWFHEVCNLTTSISLGYNFLHISTLLGFFRWTMQGGLWKQRFFY
jgi:ribosomal protein L16 Arg81 hydroxylase